MVKQKVNRVIKFLITSSALLSSGWGFVMPVFAIFIFENIVKDGPNEAAKIAGFAFFIYWFVKSLLQIPISKYLDAHSGEKDDFWFMVLGLILSGLPPFGFLLSSEVWHIYAFEALHAFSMALFVPSWYAIFTRHMDRGKEAFEWGLDSTFLGIGTAITGAVGGIMVVLFGFTAIFVSAGIISILSGLLLLFIHKDILPKDHISPWFFMRRPHL